MLKGSKLSLCFLGCICVGIVVISFSLNQKRIENGLKQKTMILGATTAEAPDQSEKIGRPLRIQIPKMDIDTTIQSVGLTQDGAMDVPSITSDVGWFSFGPRPGEKGSAVIAGHLNGVDGSKGVFEELRSLEPGDSVFIEDDMGKRHAFIVRKSHTYNAGDDVFEVFNQSEGIHLNLITCDGLWNIRTKSYTKSLVVFADSSE
ncbi:MAG: class F sortase [Candidatus Woesebacteria bacterium]